jgi:colanic acid/amylovoran biosynthesis glycosyltransferase
MTHPLAVLTPETGRLSETFVEWDCTRLLPDRTAVITDPPPRGETVLDGPWWHVDGPSLAFAPLPDDPPPSRSRADALNRFVLDRGVEVLLVQYLDLAVRWLDILRRLPVPVWVRGHGIDLSARLHPRYAGVGDLAGVMVPTTAAVARLAPDLLRRDQVHVVPNHVDVPASPPAVFDDATVRYLMVGRLVEKKGHADLLYAFAEARRHHPAMTLDLVGDGPLRHRLAQLVQRLELAGTVRLLGARPAAEVLVRTARTHVYVQPSVTGPDGDSEGQPVALLQAMAAARACVATRHAGMAETLTDGESAVLVDEGDRERLAHALVALASDADARDRLGRAAWRVAAAQHSHRTARHRLLHLLGLERHA